jgi:hypothetical protein
MTYFAVALIPFALGLFTLTDFEFQKSERRIFQLERKNNYYAPTAFTGGVILGEWVIMRIIPPLLAGVIFLELTNVGVEKSSNPDDSTYSSLGSGDSSLFYLGVILMSLCAAAQSRAIGTFTTSTAVAMIVSCALTFIQALLIILVLLEPNGKFATQILLLGHRDIPLVA